MEINVTVLLIAEQSEANDRFRFKVCYVYIDIYVPIHDACTLRKLSLQLRKLFALMLMPCIVRYLQDCPLAASSGTTRGVSSVHRDGWRWKWNWHWTIGHSTLYHQTAQRGMECVPATEDTDHLAMDCLQKKHRNTRETILRHATQLQSLHTCLSFAY